MPEQPIETEPPVYRAVSIWKNDTDPALRARLLSISYGSREEALISYQPKSREAGWSRIPGVIIEDPKRSATDHLPHLDVGIWDLNKPLRESDC